uniref:ATP synthase complex subunit 8 n=1 Tax=Podocnemis expansa TaxID=44507 RepID=A0A343L9Y1_PODEX|nr:ATP synthase F0 subunit 8 [Podocnemis expansa]DBA36333.1 TPA_inf: ATP synthase F0 subunit 8 [Podocnemis expansa]
MPQLNPDPWLSTLLLSWLIMITIIQPKIYSHLTTNQISTKTKKSPTTSPWTWPWTNPSSTNSHPQKP